MRFGTIISTLFLLLLANSLPGQADLKGYLDSTQIRIGDHLGLHLLLNCRPGTEIGEPDISVFEEEENLEVLKVGDWDTVDIGNRITLQKNLMITAWDSGYYQVPPIPVTYTFQGRTDTLYTLPIPLEVRIIPTDSSSITPIKPIIEEPTKLIDYWPFFAGLGGLLLIGLLIYLLLKRKNKLVEVPKEPEVIRPPHEIALEKLHRLEADGLWQKGAVKEYHSELTYIVREYLETRYRTPALESTTTQLLNRLRRTDFPPEWIPKLQALLQTADLVKFAKAQPAQDFHTQAMQEARRLVEDTIYIPPVVEDTEEEE